jgi:thioredoxin reductase
MTTPNSEKMIILGAGPAGLAAALYAARANLEPLVFTGSNLGGQVSLTYMIENYPAFPKGSPARTWRQLLRNRRKSSVHA